METPRLRERKFCRLSDAARATSEKILEMLDEDKRKKRRGHGGAVNIIYDKKHDLKTLREHKTGINTELKDIADTGYTETNKLHRKTGLPEKRSGRKLLNKEEIIASKDRFLKENTIGLNKRFKIIIDKNKNRRNKFALRSNITAGIQLILSLIDVELQKKSGTIPRTETYNP